MISNYSIKSISKTLKRKTLEKMQNNEKEKAKASKTLKENRPIVADGIEDGQS